MKNQAEETMKLFHVNKKLAVLVLLSLPILLKLGFWQLDRAEIKRRMQIAISQRSQQPAQTICSYVTKNNQYKNKVGKQLSTAEHKKYYLTDLQFKPVKISGRLTNQYFLIDNQTYKSQVGYEVIQILHACGAYIALSRGFIAANPDRQILPSIDLAVGDYTGLAYLYMPEKNRWLKNVAAPPNWPKRIAQADVDFMQSLLKKPLFPAIARLQLQQPLLLAAHWNIMTIDANRHVAYAIQWFGIAIVICISFIYSAISHHWAKK